MHNKAVLILLLLTVGLNVQGESIIHKNEKKSDVDYKAQVIKLKNLLEKLLLSRSGLLCAFKGQTGVFKYQAEFGNIYDYPENAAETNDLS